MTRFNEDTLEQATLGWLSELGWARAFGPEIAPGETAAEREDFSQVVLESRLRAALERLNPSLPPEALQDAFHKLTRPSEINLTANNRAFHRMAVNGVTVEYSQAGRIIGAQAQVFDFERPENNDWLAVNQFTIVGSANRRPDIILFVNGLPLVVLELKNPADEHATIWNAFNQLQTYKQQIPALFTYNEALVISDGQNARIGALTADKARFSPWKTVDGAGLDSNPWQLETLVRGVFAPQRFLTLVRHFIVFEDDTAGGGTSGNGQPVKKMAAYHQFHAVKVAVDETLRALKENVRRAREPRAGYRTQNNSLAVAGDGRIGVVWHTQGSGKSLTMAFYAGSIILHPALQNPTLVVLTDRNDLDDQLFATFSRCQELLRQKPVQAESREHLRQILQVASGGVIFTTIQKFALLPSPANPPLPLGNARSEGASPPLPLGNARGEGALSDRSNIIVIADEAHRSQYDFVDGYARAMRDALPNASFIGFTGTPIELRDANTRAVFGDYISVYDIQQAVNDGATVPIYYEGRLAKLELKETEKPKIDPEFEEITEGEETLEKEKLKTKWAALEAVVGTPKRLSLIAQDLLDHFDKRLDAHYGEGKAMVVCMSRRICVDLYNAIIALRPEWHSDDDAQGVIKIVMTGSAADKTQWQGHLRNKERREALANRFKDPRDPFKLVIVRDMWLTGFDVPCLHTMYLDKPMQGHGLMQAIARVNRVYGETKKGGLIVDYLGLAWHLQQALALYTESGGTGQGVINQEEAVAIVQREHEICRDLFHGFDYSAWRSGAAHVQKQLIANAIDHLLALANGKQRFLQTVSRLSQSFALAVPHPAALALRDDVGFFQAVRAAIIKSNPDHELTAEEIEQSLRQMLSRAVASDEVIDIFKAAGLKKPDISILSDEFLAEVAGIPQRNLAVELLRKLLSDEIKLRQRTNLVQSRSFREMLERTIIAYQNRSLETTEIIAELVKLAQEMREAHNRGETLGLSEAELAFYDALEVNDSAVKILGDDVLKGIARELVQKIRANVTIDWTVRETVRAKLRALVKRTLRNHGYPPDKQEQATDTVLEQAELLARDWAG